MTKTLNLIFVVFLLVCAFAKPKNVHSFIHSHRVMKLISRQFNWKWFFWKMHVLIPLMSGSNQFFKLCENGNFVEKKNRWLFSYFNKKKKKIINIPTTMVIFVHKIKLLVDVHWLTALLSHFFPHLVVQITISILLWMLMSHKIQCIPWQVVDKFSTLLSWCEIF